MIGRTECAKELIRSVDLINGKEFVVVGLLYHDRWVLRTYASDHSRDRICYIQFPQRFEGIDPSSVVLLSIALSFLAPRNAVVDSSVSACCKSARFMPPPLTLKRHELFAWGSATKGI
ncbi:hypothetical protein BHM03_00045968 [Ensete ventricosum]|nr:hypothetical protein BHM03_00045968 [Ensete ventricosum]